MGSEDLSVWQCHRCGSPPLELQSGFTEYRLGTCSNYRCPTRAPRKTKREVRATGQSTFIRRTS